eukprot:763999-Hanusia_phi.AAC.3
MLTANEELQVVIGSENNNLTLWSLESGMEINRIENVHKQKITSLCTYKLANEHRLVSGDLRGNVKLWVLRSDGMRILVRMVWKQKRITDAFARLSLSLQQMLQSLNCIRFGHWLCYGPFCSIERHFMLGCRAGCKGVSSGSDPDVQVPGDGDNVPMVAESETESQGEKVRQMTAITSLQMFEIESGRSLLLLQQDVLVRVFSMKMECERFSATSGALMDLKAMYIPRNHLAPNTRNEDSQTSSMTRRRREHNHATIVCLSSNGVIELFSGKDGSIVNVIEPSVARDILESGGIADDSKQNNGRKKKRPKKKKQAKKDMSATEKRALMAKRIIARVQNLETGGKERPNRMRRKIRMSASYWSDGSIDILDSEDGKCKCTYGSPLVGLVDPAAMAADDTMKMTCFTFTSKERLRTESLRHQLSSDEADTQESS